MARRGYVIAFIVVLLIAGIGGFLGGRILLQRLQSDFGLRPEAEWTPVATRTAAAPEPRATAIAAAGPTSTAVPSAAQDTPTRLPTATVLVVTAPDTTPLPPTAQSTPKDIFEPLPTLSFADTITSTATIEPTDTPAPAFPFALARAVRYSNGDCPGTYALGIVTDRAGSPLPNVRLSLVDEYGNAQTVTTKSGQGDAGRYDFPMFGDPRRFFMSVVDEGGRPLSERVQIVHNMSPHENQPCRWVDWRRR